MKWSVVGFALFVCGLLVGCGPSIGEVKGTVTYGDQTVKTGKVIIFGSDGVPKTADIQRDGTYSIKDVAFGNVKIAVQSPNPAQAAPKERDKPASVDPVDVQNWFAIHPSYNDPGTSGLTATLKGKPAIHDIKMTPKQ
ncbi:MAG TPA: hypothetical protein VFE62_24130 [Gemmataceae bacterium]|nr:hypothetical protein [Gemmataceae bacterium]